jgi:hypothetical protein
LTAVDLLLRYFLCANFYNKKTARSGSKKAAKDEKTASPFRVSFITLNVNEALLYDFF